ncbi:hypothetical protein HDE_03941 [Halotydeus destructor]|nr:hypothetical protein HDE_03941 [Halotydeus destructor]
MMCHTLLVDVVDHWNVALHSLAVVMFVALRIQNGRRVVVMNKTLGTLMANGLHVTCSLTHMVVIVLIGCDLQQRWRQEGVHGIICTWPAETPSLTGVSLHVFQWLMSSSVLLIQSASGKVLYNFICLHHVAMVILTTSVVNTRTSPGVIMLLFNSCLDVICTLIFVLRIAKFISSDTRFVIQRWLTYVYYFCICSVLMYAYLYRNTCDITWPSSMIMSIAVIYLMTELFFLYSKLDIKVKNG